MRRLVRVIATVAAEFSEAICFPEILTMTLRGSPTFEEVTFATAVDIARAADSISTTTLDPGRLYYRTRAHSGESAGLEIGNDNPHI
jgi:hypothetical protein